MDEFSSSLVFFDVCALYIFYSRHRFLADQFFPLFAETGVLTTCCNAKEREIESWRRSWCTTRWDFVRKNENLLLSNYVSYWFWFSHIFLQRESRFSSIFSSAHLFSRFSWCSLWCVLLGNDVLGSQKGSLESIGPQLASLNERIHEIELLSQLDSMDDRS